MVYISTSNLKWKMWNLLKIINFDFLILINFNEKCSIYSLLSLYKVSNLPDAIQWLLKIIATEEWKIIKWMWWRVTIKKKVSINNRLPVESKDFPESMRG